MQHAIRKTRKAFSLIELVIVVVIIGIIAAIAIPKMSRGATGAGEAALAADLQVLRNALEMYQSEHNGSYPDPTSIGTQLTQTTTPDGTPTPSGQTGVVVYGPYLKAIPGLPVGTAAQRGKSGISTSPGPTIGWLYNPELNTISANASGSDGAGTNYSQY